MKYVELEDRVVCDDSGYQCGEVTWIITGENTICIDHTMVDVSYEGRGIGYKLVKMAYDLNKAKGYNVTATCLFAAKYVDVWNKN